MSSITSLRNLLRAHHEHGNSLVETALVVPVLILLIVVAVDLGRASTIAIAAESAAHAGAIYGSLHPTDTAGMLAAAKLDAVNWTVVVPAASYGCECSDGSSAVVACATVPSCTYNSVYYVKVTTTAVFTPILPYAGLGSGLTMRGAASLRAPR